MLPYPITGDLGGISDEPLRECGMKTIIAIVLSFLFASVCVSQGVSLKDTLLWMHNFVADNSS